MGRPKHYTESTKVRLSPNGDTRLQKDSDRRAIVQEILDRGGVASIGELNEHYKFDTSEVVKRLVHSHWLEVINENDQ